MDTPFWIDIDIDATETSIRLAARGSRGEITAPRDIPLPTERLETFARKVGRAVKLRQPIDSTTLGEAQALHAAIFDGEFRDLFIRMTEAAKGLPVLHRLVLRHRALQGIPWEALCQPSSAEGFWSTAPTIHLARGVPSAEPWKPRNVRGAVRLLVVAPGAERAALENVQKAVAEPVAAGAIEWLEPIVGPRASLRLLFETLRHGKRPYILHFIGHGSVDALGNPRLRLTDNEDGDEEWIKAESLARECVATLGQDLRLVVLEACDGAQPGVFGSAAEIFNHAGVDAVIAHLWPVRADVAGACSRDLYRSLTAGGAAEGNVAASLANVRRTLLLHGAEAFSPVLYLRGTAATLFRFDKSVVPPDTTPSMLATNTAGPGGTQWLTGALVPIWKGGTSAPARLRFDLRHDDGSVSTLEKPLDPQRTSYIGRKEKRKDKTTANDFVLPSSRVSQDAASIEYKDGRWLIRNTSDKPSILVNLSPLQPGETRALAHGTLVVVGDVSGLFLDGRFFMVAPATAVDPQTGLLAREGITCEVAVILASRKPRSLLMFQWAPGEIQAPSLAARVLHAAEPLPPIGRIDSTVGMLVENKSNMTERLEILHKAGFSPRATGFLELSGPSAEAGARVDAALGALARLVAAGGANEPVDLARYALAVISLPELALFARQARATGGGMGLLLLDEFERYGILGEASRAAIELELQEQLGSLLASGDRLASVGPGAIAVATKHPVERLLRDAATAWRARGPIAVGALELDRGLRVFVLDETTAEQLVAQPVEFLRDVGAGTNAHGLPTPIAHWLDVAHRAGTVSERASALVRTIETTWRLLGCVFVAAFWSTRKRDILDTSLGGAAWPPWRGLAEKAAESLRSTEGRLGELAQAVCQAASLGTGALAIASEKAMALSSQLLAPSRDERALEQATTALELSIHEVFAALRTLRGWSLVAVREAEPLDALGTASDVDYVDFTGPHALGVLRRDTVCGIRVLPFVYLARWAEGIAIPLEPLVRRVNAEGTNGDGLVIVDNIPAGPGLHAYTPVSWEGRVELSVTPRQLAR